MIASKEHKESVLDLLYVEVPEEVKNDIEGHFAAIYIFGEDE